MIIDVTSEGSVYTHTLQIKTLQFVDQGEYTCNVKFAADDTEVKPYVTDVMKLCEHYGYIFFS